MRYKVKERREQLGMTQAELVKKTGLSRAIISVIENDGDTDVKISTLDAIAKALRCSPASLYESEVHSGGQGQEEYDHDERRTDS